MIGTPQFPAPNPNDPQNERQFREAVQQAIADIYRVIAREPEIRTTAVRGTGANLNKVTVTHDIIDPSKMFIEMEYQYNAGGWLTGGNWTSSSTGVQYVKEISLTPGLDSIYEYRMLAATPFGARTDAVRGAARRYHGGTLNLADLQAQTNTLVFVPTHGMPNNDTIGFDTSIPGVVAPSAAGTALTWRTPIILPPGISITRFRQRGLRANAGDTCSADFRYTTSDTGVSTRVLSALLNKTSGGGWDWTGLDETLGTPHTVVGGDERTYYVENVVNGAASVLDAACGRIQITYTRSAAAASQY